MVPVLLLVLKLVRAKDVVCWQSAQVTCIKYWVSFHKGGGERAGIESGEEERRGEERGGREQERARYRILQGLKERVVKGSLVESQRPEVRSSRGRSCEGPTFLTSAPSTPLQGSFCPLKGPRLVYGVASQRDCQPKADLDVAEAPGPAQGPV